MLFFLEQFLVHSEVEQKHRVSEYPHPPKCPSSPTINILHQSEQLLQLMNLHEYILSSKSVVYVRAHSWCCIFCGF